MTRWWFVAALLLLWGCAPPETRLTAELTAQAGDKVLVRGETALPDGAQLNVTLEPMASPSPLAVELPVVKAGRYEALLDPKAALPAGTYRVKVMFSPRAFAWSEAVKPAVGPNGEKLGGPNVKDSGEGYRVLELEREVRLP